MITSEPRDQTIARRQRMTGTYPELAFSSPTQISQVDASTPDALPTSFTQDMVRYADTASSPDLGFSPTNSWLSRADEPAPEPPVGPVGPMGPIGPQSSAYPGFGWSLDEARRRAAQQTPEPTTIADPISRRLINDTAGEFVGELTEPQYTGSNPILREATRLTNYAFGPGAIIPSAVANIVAPHIVEAAQPLIRQLPEGAQPWADAAVGIGAGIGTFALTHRAQSGGKIPLGMSVDDVSGGASANENVARETSAPVTASEALFGLKPPAQELSRADRVLNSLKETIGIGVPESDVATPIMRERMRVQKVAESQAARIGAIADQTAKAFPLNKFGRVAGLPGEPTIQDVAARLPQYESYLDDAQRAAMQRLHQETAPFAQALKEQGVDLASRADVQEGGFYLPRGNAALEGADEPLKVYAGRGMAGGKKGFERGAVFDSMAEGIDAGYQYAPLRSALQGYAKNAADRATDAWAVNQFKDSGAGLTAKEAILQSQPGLASKKAALDGNLQRLRGLAASLNERTQRTIERFIADPQFDSIDDLRAALPETVTRGSNAGDTIRDVRDALAQVKQDISDLRPDWNKALERARTPRSRGGIGFAGLQGTTFPDEIANAANKYLNAEKPATGAGSVVLNAANAFNGLMRGLRASADLSFMGIQGLLGAVQHPRQYGTALKVALKSLGDEGAAGKFITEFDDTARAAGRPDSSAWNAAGNRLGGMDTEFTIGQGVKGLGQRIQNLPVIKQSNRAFGAFGDTLRLASDDALYAARQGAGKAVGEQEMKDIAKFSNLMTGYSEKRFLGDVGALTEFAPRFFQSQLDLVGNALTNRGIVGQQARQSLGKLVGIGGLLTVAANEARGKETSYDPNDPNFMRIRDVAGNDISLFGPWDSLVRGIMHASQGDFSYMARSKASPLVSLAWDELSGKSFVGENTRTPEYILRQLLPFGLAQVGQEGQNAVGTAMGLSGLKTTPLSPTDNVQAGKFKELPPEQQFRAIKPEAWQRVQSTAPDSAKAVLKDYNSLYDWYQAAHDVYEERATKSGKTKAEAQRIADAQTRAHPVYQMYLNQRKVLTNQWVQANPDVARQMDDDQSDLPPSERTFNPTKPQRAMIGAAP